jgi:hypothetical protein
MASVRAAGWQPLLEVGVRGDGKTVTPSELEGWPLKPLS